MSTQKPPAFFISGWPGLDFLNTLATSVDVQVDWIDSGDGLLAWLEEAGLATAEELKALRDRAIPGEFDAVAAQARGLREWFRGFVRERSGRKLGPDDVRELEPLNRLLDRDERFYQVVIGPEGVKPALELKARRRLRTPEALLLPIAEEIARFVCSEDFEYAKACEGSTCTLLFVDRTRGRARRWCSMAICGNRAKQAAHRDRRKAGE
ncbi:CGNR zinc finger domain-containing protein [Planctomyces sp. SH-PL62]|uniref:CGNR zinc finger domain-containing protein n=1 Tax=Planctomyces sp. SH-PL62 TaxID=1636152 RepID=UPI00078C3145|nr:ABATE domain-containing protein [Planctomyces sp. SH-PL62]AMV40161.1 CGNR zinc finger [Planctomyces sp. SH-PL62]